MSKTVYIHGYAFSATKEDGGWFLDHQDSYGNTDASFGPYYMPLSEACEEVRSELVSAECLISEE